MRGCACRARERAPPGGLRFVIGWPLRLPSRDEATTIATARSVILAHFGLADLYPTADAVIARFAELMRR